MQTNPVKPSLRRLGPALLLAACVALMAVPPAAAATDNPGTIKVHDEATMDPPEANQPHVDCDDFWIQGFDMASGSGTLAIFSWPPTGNKTLVLFANWTTDTGQAGAGFLAGPFTLPAGHYHVEAFLDDGHPGNTDHFTKAKTFWVEPCQPTPDLQCPSDLAATANADGSITLTFTPAAGSDGTLVYRTDSADFTAHLATLDANATSYTDKSAVPGAAYTYSVTAFYGDEESAPCPVVEVSSIPDLPTPVAIGLAGLLGVVGYAALRRRS